jgi:hypothetical protein
VVPEIPPLESWLDASQLCLRSTHPISTQPMCTRIRLRLLSGAWGAEWKSVDFELEGWAMGLAGMGVSGARLFAEQ